ncbi:hypothetical protein Ndes2526B_g05848 [Nannochloris sp. 'desiccata']
MEASTSLPSRSVHYTRINHRQVKQLRLQIAARSSAPATATARSTSKSKAQAQTKQGTNKPSSSSGDSYFNVTGYPFPLGPITKRKTIRREIERNSIWVFEQPQSLGFSNVTTNCRMTVIKLASGALWVHAPIAPTAECLRLLKELDAPVEYIILPTFAYEHKIFVGPFSRKFPKAKVYIAPKQWSWPINLPPQFFGIFPTGILKDGDTTTPWANEIEQKVLVSSVGIGPYIEVAFFLKKSRTLLVTDAVISVPEKPSELVPDADLVDAATSNFFIRVLAGDKADEPVNGVPLKPTELTPAVRDLGWRRMAMQILYIVPGDLRDPAVGFKAVANKLIVGPILKTLVFSTEPDASKEWINSICRDWRFTSIIPAHFQAPIKAGPAEFKAAFGFLYEGQGKQQKSANAGGFLGSLFNGGAGGFSARKGVQYPADDIKALDNAKKFLVKIGAVNK